MTNINKDNIIDCLNELSSKEMQVELWLSDGKSGFTSSFTEAVEGLFTDSGLNDELSSSKVVFSDRIDENLRDLSLELSKISYKMSVIDLINSFSMGKIRVLAREILEDMHKA